MSIGSFPIDTEDNGGRKVLRVSSKPNWSPSYSTAPPTPATNTTNNNNHEEKNHPLQRGHIDLSPLKQQAQLICHALSPTVRQKQKQNYKYINANLQTQIHKYANTDTHFMIMTINKECIFNCTEGTFCPATYCPSDILSRRHIVPA